MNEVRLGVIGVGGMGGSHARNIMEGKVERARLTAVCDSNPAQLEKFAGVAGFTDAGEMIASGEVDAVILATPHYAHTTVGIQILQAGLHLLIEKPISVHKADAERLLAAHKDKKQIFAAMFNQRIAPRHRKLKSLLDEGVLGEISRVNWTVTDWYRPEAYYRSGGWRATWKGEGGGVLLNQCPHQLDMLQWFCGMPVRVQAFCGFGVCHDIEVEDQVTAYLEYANGATGVFITTTGEAPGTNRLEIAGEMGKLVMEPGREIEFTRNEISSREFSRTNDKMFAKPDTWDVKVPAKGDDPGHMGIVRNFVEAILDGAELIAPAEEGIRSVELGNAMLLSTLKKKMVELPLDGAEFEAELGKLIAGSKRS